MTTGSGSSPCCILRTADVSIPPAIKTHTWLLDSTSKPVPAIMVMLGHHIQSGSRPLYLRWLATNVTLTSYLSKTLTNGSVLTSTAPLELKIPSPAVVPYNDPLLRCQENNTVWCGQNHIIAIYPQVKGSNGVLGSINNVSSTEQHYDVAQLRLKPGYFEGIAANNRSGFNITQFQLDVGLAQAEGGRLLSETSPIGVIQLSTFGPDAGIEQSTAPSVRMRKNMLVSALAALLSTLLSSY